MSYFKLPRPQDVFRKHAQWSQKSLKPYTEELLDLWAENNIDGLLDVQLQGPSLTRFGIVPDNPRSASRILELAPTYRNIFGRSDIRVYRGEGRVYIDIPWKIDDVYLGDLICNEEFRRSEGLALAVGLDIYRDCYIDDLTDVPHLLVAGSHSQGRKNFLNGCVASVLCAHTPDEIELCLCCGQHSELEYFKKLSQYVGVYTDGREMLSLLSALNEEADRRYEALYRTRCRDIYDFGEIGGKMKHLFVLISEYEYLTAMNKKVADRLLRRLLELGGNCGIHVVVSSEHADTLRGVADFIPARICFRTDSMRESFAVLERRGAERLSRKGALFYQDGFSPAPFQLQSGIVTAKELRDLADALALNFSSRPQEKRSRGGALLGRLLS